MTKRKRNRKEQRGLTTLQRQIKTRREKLGLSQTDLAARIPVDKGAVSHWESGANSPRTSLLPDVARALETTVAELHTEAA